MADNKELQFELTKYGRTRIASVLEGETLALTKIKIGTGKDNKYYELTNDMLEDFELDLQGLIPDYEFYVYDKELLEDGLTISFHTIIPETVGGFDIREFGLYEVDANGDDHLFAISVQQPFVKPSSEYNYFINLNYYMFLKSANLADLYDQIVLDVEHAQVSEANLEELMRTFLFAQENLMVQIGENSKIIGYNRPTQIIEKVNENKQSYSYITLYKNFASILDLIENPENIFSYWIFDYSRRETLGSSVIDLSNNKNYLTTNKTLNSYPHLYRGFQSMFSFSGDDNYSLPSSVPINLYDDNTEEDSPFTMVFVLEPHGDYYGTARTIIAKSNKALSASIFEVQELPNGVLQVRLYASEDNYITFTSGENVIPNEPHSIVLTYNPEFETYNAETDEYETNPRMLAYINSTQVELELKKLEGKEYTHMSNSIGGTLYEYQSKPRYTMLTGTDKINNVEKGNLVFCYSDGETRSDELEYWRIEEIETETETGLSTTYKVQYKLGDTYIDATKGTEQGTATLYAFHYQDNYAYLLDTDVVIDGDNVAPSSEEVTFYNDNFEGISSNFVVELDSDNYVVKYYDPDTGVGHSATYDAQKNVIRTITQYYFDVTETIFSDAPSSTGLTSNNYKLYEKNNNGMYFIYTGDNWQFEIENTSDEGTTYKLVYYYNAFEGVASGNGDKAVATQVETINLDTPPLTSYIIDSSGQPINYINSNVGIISIIKEELSPINARTLALNLCATLGMNPFLSGEQ